MKTKKFLAISLMLTCFINPSKAFSQTSQVAWSSFNMGFGVPTSATTAVNSAVGQSFVGATQSASTQIESGFLAYTALGTTTPVEEVPEPGLPSSFELQQNYPNPFNPTTKIEFSLPRNSIVHLTVYDILGKEVATLLDELRPAGHYTIEWNGQDTYGGKVSTGVYFYRLEATAPGRQTPFISLKKMLLLK